MNVDPSARFMLWIDEVGGFLVCLADKIILGQFTPSGGVDVPIMADLSRKHATIVREGENYLIVPERDVRLGGRPITKAAALADGSSIGLDSSVQMRFRQPHPLSATARLEPVSHHRTQPSADAVLLMAESCVLGPGGSHHVVCRNWSRELVIYRDGAGLACRTTGKVTIDDREYTGGGPLSLNSHVAAEDLSFSLERI